MKITLVKEIAKNRLVKKNSYWENLKDKTAWKTKCSQNTLDLDFCA